MSGRTDCSAHQVTDLSVEAQLPGFLWRQTFRATHCSTVRRSSSSRGQDEGPHSICFSVLLPQDAKGEVEVADCFRLLLLGIAQDAGSRLDLHN